MEKCPECNGEGKIPQYPKPYTPLTPEIIRAIRENAPKCSVCNGKGYVGTKEDE
jgi:RecJ-like exonuclease